MKRKKEFTDMQGVSPDIFELIRQMPEVEPSPNFTAVVMSRLKSEKHLENIPVKKQAGWLKPLMPSFGYALVFLIFLGFGLGINQVLDIPNSLNSSTGSQPTAGANVYASNEGNDNIDIAKMFEESQNLRLINVQEQTVALLVNGNNEGNSGANHGR